MQKPAPKTLSSVTLTRGFRVSVLPHFIAEQSSPDESRYIFSYRIRIANESDLTAKLLSRHWIITDGNGIQHTVQGDGVIGQQPTLAAGQVHEYSSYCPLPTPWGTMEGSYTMQSIIPGEPGELFEIEIGRFYLIMPED